MRKAAPQVILVIDNDWRVLLGTDEALQRVGYDVITRDRASGSIATILREKPDIVLIDPDMPGISGENLIKIFGNSERRGDFLILLHSNLPLHELHQIAITCGADGYVQKTDSAARLVSQINYWSVRVRPPVSGVRLRMLALTPLTVESEPLPEPEKPRILTPTAKFGVLLVDDDPSIIKAYRRAGFSDEFNCLFAESGEQAAALLHSEPQPDVVVCDLLMAGVSGAELYERAVSRDASWRKAFIFTTGFGSVEHISNFIKRVDAPVLQKPVSNDDLREAIRHAARTARIYRPLVRFANS